MIVPILFLIATCVLAMYYNGGGFEGASLIDAFANCTAADALVLGSFATLIFTFLMYVPRGILNFGQFCEAFTEGFKAMVPAIFILTFAWTLSGICSEDYLNLRGFVASYIHADAAIGMFMPAIFFVISLGIAFAAWTLSGICSEDYLNLRGFVASYIHADAAIGMFMPAIFFVISLGIAFATGTSWGTFGILIPVAFSIFPDAASLNMLTITVAACLAGAVCGDHISPISDTTILASAGAQCKHLDHVSTQIPYALTVAAISFIGYLAAGITGSGWVGLGVGAVLLAVFAVYMTRKCKAADNAES